MMEYCNERAHIFEKNNDTSSFGWNSYVNYYKHMFLALLQTDFSGHDGIDLDTFKNGHNIINIYKKENIKIIPGDRPISETMSRIFNPIKHYTKAKLGQLIGESLYQAKIGKIPDNSSQVQDFSKSACELVSSNPEFAN